MVDNQAVELVEKINKDMRQAMKDREVTKLNTLKSLLARISNAEAVSVKGSAAVPGEFVSGAAEGVGSTEAQRKRLSLLDVNSIILAEVNEIEAALKGLDETSEYATELREKAAVIKKYAM